jgi:hypothetical protein
MKEELEDRLVKFVISIYKLCEGLTESHPAIFMSNRLMHAASVTALHCGEAGYASCPDVFEEKIGMVSSKLREIQVNLQILFMARGGGEDPLLIALLQENCILQDLLKKPEDILNERLVRMITDEKL